MGEPLLECRELVAGHGSVVAVRPLDLALQAGTVTAVLGPNGAGKTTLLATLAGVLPRLGGEVHFDGKRLVSGRPTAANRAGIVLVPDDRALFKSLTVQENIEIARRRRTGPPAEQMLELFPSLEKRWKLAAGALSGGEQQMLAMARGLVQQPRALLVDEMSMGLAPVVVEQLLPVVRRVADESDAVVVIVEQHVKLALEVADEAIVLVHGEVSLRGPARELASSPERLEAAYLGAHDADPSADGHRAAVVG
jgi:branched-chain amino acid transport system ATP-binding protein